MPIKSVNFKKYSRQHENLSNYLVNQKDTGMFSIKFKNNKPYIILREDIMSDFYIILDNVKHSFHTKVKKQNLTIIFSNAIPGKFLDILNDYKVAHPLIHPGSLMDPPEKDTAPSSPPIIRNEIYHHIDNTGLTPHSDEYPEDKSIWKSRQTMNNLKKKAQSIIQERQNQYSGPLNPFQKTLYVDTGGLYKHFDADFDEYKTLIHEKGKGSVEQICDWTTNERRKSLDPLNRQSKSLDPLNNPPNLPIHEVREGDIAIPAQPNTIYGYCHLKYIQGGPYYTPEPKEDSTIIPNTVCDNCHIEYIQGIYPTCPYCTVLPLSKSDINNLPHNAPGIHICRKCCIVYPSSYKICPYPCHVKETGSSKCSSPGSSKCSSESDFVIVESL